MDLASDLYDAKLALVLTLTFKIAGFYGTDGPSLSDFGPSLYWIDARMLRRSRRIRQDLRIALSIRLSRTFLPLRILPLAHHSHPLFRRSNDRQARL